MAKLDETKPYGTLFVGTQKYYGQEGRCFDIASREEVELSGATPPAPSVPPPFLSPPLTETPTDAPKRKTKKGDLT